MKHKIIPMLLCLMLCMAFMPAAAFADNAKTTPEEPPGIWTDYAAADFAGGSGTAEEPYQIATPQQLAKLAADINSGDEGKKHSGEHFKLTADLNLSAHRWIPIGSGDLSLGHYNFSGYFDGNGKTITGLYVNESQLGFCGGLFGIVYGYEIKNLTVKDAYVKKEAKNSYDYGKTGILMGAVWGSKGSEINIKDCSVSGTVESKGNYTGGLVGYSHRGVYENCTADAEVTGSDSTGGFAGQDDFGTYKNCTVLGDVNGADLVGGFAGYLTEESQVSRCAAFGKVTASGKTAGGFVGMIQDFTTISNCAAFGDVESTVEGAEPQAGGFVGYDMHSTISNSHAAGTITVASSKYKAGGFAGETYYDSGKFESSSFDIEKNAGLQAIGGETPAAADGVEAVSSQAVKDKICKDYYGKHIVKAVAGRPATCTEDGQKAYWECENCERLFADENGMQSIEKPEVIKATGHKLTSIAKKPATCTEDGHEAYWKCENCGLLFADENGMKQIENPVVIPATGHKFGDWKVIKEAKAGVDGSRERACVNCDYTETEAIPALEVQDTAKTGDDSNIALYGILALLAAGGAAGALCRRWKA